MKLFWMKNKVLLATLAAMLALGGLFWGGLRLFEGGRMQDVMVRTSFAEAEATATSQPAGNADAPAQPAATAAPSPVPATQAEDLQWMVVEREWRYNSVIPSINDSVPDDNRSWKEGDKVDDELAAKARKAAVDVFDWGMNVQVSEDDMTVTRYVDEAGYRENILRMTNEKKEYVCVLKEKDLSLVAADSVAYHANAQIDAASDASDVAQKLLFTQTKAGVYDRGGSYGRVRQVTFAIALADGRYLTLAYTDGGLHGIKVHPNEAAMEESVCFLSDIRHHEAFVKQVAVENFEAGDLQHIAEGDMTPDQAELLYRNFLSAANSRASERREAEHLTLEQYDYNLKEGEISYFLDKSGYRENYYHIENRFVTMDIAARTGYIVRAACSGLYNLDPALNLLGIEYDHWGEQEYKDYMKHVIDATFGPDSYDSIDVNAVADDLICTMDVDMKDGRWYEFGFTKGRLMYIEHYAAPRVSVPGWGADSLYVNTITGEEFYQW